MLNVIIPVYNGRQTLEASILSTRHLAPIDYAIIVVDDGSQDESSVLAEEIMGQYKIKGSVIRKELNQGVSEARNTGIERASSEWIMFLDADDDLLPGSGDRILSALKKTDKKVVSFAYLVNGVPSPQRNKKITPFDDFLKRKYFNTNTVVCRRECFFEERFRVGFAVGEDTDLWARVLFKNSSEHHDFAVARYNLVHKVRVPERHPFYDVTLYELGLSAEKVSELREFYESYILRHKAALREVSLLSLLKAKDISALLLYFFGPSSYGWLWKVKRWLKL